MVPRMEPGTETPYKLLEEKYTYDPWRFLVVALLLNRVRAGSTFAFL
jgi:hypothetical protein